MSQPTSGSTAALESRDVRKHFGATEIIRGINPTVSKGEHHALIGPNDADKSTTLDLISGRFPASSGSVHLNDEEISGLAPFEINRRDLSRNFQITNIFHHLSVFENLCYAVLWLLGYKYSFWHKLAELCDVRECAGEVLEQTGMTHQREAATGLLTHIERRALEIGITIAGGADVVLLDEPMAGVSRSESGYTIEPIRKVTAGKTLAMVEHDMNAVFGLVDRISAFVYGKVIATDTSETIRNNRRVKEAHLGTMLDEPAGAY